MSATSVKFRGNGSEIGVWVRVASAASGGLSLRITSLPDRPIPQQCIDLVAVDAARIADAVLKEFRARKGNGQLKDEPIETEDDRRLVTVCRECLRASCFQGKFYCGEDRNAATRDLPVAALRALKLENPSYWEPGAEAKP